MLGAHNDDGLLVLIDFYKYVKSSPKVEFSPYVVENRKILDNRINMLKQTIGNLEDYGVSNGSSYYNYDYLNVVNTKKDNRDFNLMNYFIQKEYKSIKDQIK
jgi:hypothetical protein